MCIYWAKTDCLMLYADKIKAIIVGRRNRLNHPEMQGIDK